MKSSVEVNLLSAELTKSGLDEKVYTEKTLLFNPDEMAYSVLVFELLKEIICFTYNITYSEYDMENTFENSSICFP